MTDEELNAVYRDVAGPAITAQAVGRAQAGIQETEAARRKAFTDLPPAVRAAAVAQEGFRQGSILGGLFGTMADRARGTGGTIEETFGPGVMGGRLRVAKTLGTATGMGLELGPIMRAVQKVMSGFKAGAGALQMATSPVFRERLVGMGVPSAAAMGAQAFANSIVQQVAQNPNMSVREALSKVNGGQAVLDGLHGAAMGAAFAGPGAALAGMKFSPDKLLNGTIKNGANIVANLGVMSAIKGVTTGGQDFSITPEDVAMVLAPVAQRGIEAGYKRITKPAAPKVTDAEMATELQNQIERAKQALDRGEDMPEDISPLVVKAVSLTNLS